MTYLDELPHFLHDMRSAVDVDAIAHRLRTEPMFSVEMRVCREWRIPHSQLLGGDGRWTPEDREKAKAFVLWEAQRCPECGVHPQDWPTETGIDEEAPFEVHSTRCFGCQAVNAWLDSYRKATEVRGQPDPKAMWGLRTSLRPPAH